MPTGRQQKHRQTAHACNSAAPSGPSTLTCPEEVACEVACAVDLTAQQRDECVGHPVARHVRGVEEVLDQVGHVHGKAHLRAVTNSTG
jgi:hypothetical protein